MANKKTVYKNADLRKFMRRYPETDVMELLIADMIGVIRSKRIRTQEFEKVFRKGFYLPGGAVLLDTLGDSVPGMPYSTDDGDPDIRAVIVEGSLAPLPWSNQPAAQALYRFQTRDGEPFFGDPRAVLERALKPIQKMGLQVVMACELEFYLLDPESRRPKPAQSQVPGTARPQPGPQVFHPDDLWDIEEFLDDLNQACEAQGIPIGTTTSEFAPGQFEINLNHVADPVLACDHAVLLKRAVKAIALRHGYVACFMAKPFEEHSGSGMHVHMSLVDKNGKNYFSNDNPKMAIPPFSAKLRYAVGGLAKTMADATAIFAPNANSYRRLRPDMLAPVEPNWGANHRSVALRIPVSGEKNLRFEHRTSGADSNPYLVTAALLAGVHYGMKNRIDPGPMVKEGDVITLKAKLPTRWLDAIRKFERSKILREYLGKDYCDAYALNRRYEESNFNNQVTNLDFDWYLRAV
jgi:glutamine synthetase